MGIHNLRAVLMRSKQFVGGVIPERYIIRDTGEQSIRALITIGRDFTNDIIIEQEEISKVHAKVERREIGEESFYYLIDNDSLNGVYIDGQKVEKERQLNHGDCIALGDASNLILEFYISSNGMTQTQPWSSKPSPRLHWDDALQVFWIDKRENQLDLKPNEQRLLRYLYLNVGQVCAREEIARTVWIKDKAILDSHIIGSLNTLVSALRKKLGEQKNQPERTRFIRTVAGEGYLLELSPERV